MGILNISESMLKIIVVYVIYHRFYNPMRHINRSPLSRGFGPEAQGPNCSLPTVLLWANSSSTSSTTKTED